MEKTIAEALLAIKAVFFRPNDPFTWASGIKSPVYCDNRLILTAPKQRKIVEQAIADTVKINAATKNMLFRPYLSVKLPDTATPIRQPKIALAITQPWSQGILSIEK